MITGTVMYDVQVECSEEEYSNLKDALQKYAMTLKGVIGIDEVDTDIASDEPDSDDDRE